VKHTLLLPKVEIPRAFMGNDRIMRVLYSTIEEFENEEKQAIYFYYHLKLPLRAIACNLALSKMHIISTLGLYTERLASKIDLFKKALPYNADDTIQICDILFPWGINSRIN